MSKLSPDTEGFAILEALIVLVALFIIGMVAFFIANHLNKDTKPIASVKANSAKSTTTSTTPNQPSTYKQILPMNSESTGSGSSPTTSTQSKTSSSSQPPAAINQPTPSTGTYTYGNYSFPYLPSDFVLDSETTHGTNGLPEIYYTNSSSLTTIETELISACNSDGYTPRQASFSYGELSSAGPTYGYSIACDASEGKGSSIGWTISIIKGSTANDYSVSIDTLLTLP